MTLIATLHWMPILSIYSLDMKWKITSGILQRQPSFSTYLGTILSCYTNVDENNMKYGSVLAYHTAGNVPLMAW